MRPRIPDDDRDGRRDDGLPGLVSYSVSIGWIHISGYGGEWEWEKRRMMMTGNDGDGIYCIVLVDKRGSHREWLRADGGDRLASVAFGVTIDTAQYKLSSQRSGRN